MCDSVQQGPYPLVNDEQVEALQAFGVQVHGITKKINLAQVLGALENLAGQLDLQEGLEGRAKLGKQLDE